jgi:hypothetical protein
VPGKLRVLWDGIQQRVLRARSNGGQGLEEMPDVPQWWKGYMPRGEVFDGVIVSKQNPFSWYDAQLRVFDLPCWGHFPLMVRMRLLERMFIGMGKPEWVVALAPTITISRVDELKPIRNAVWVRNVGKRYKDDRAWLLFTPTAAASSSSSHR